MLMFLLMASRGRSTFVTKDNRFGEVRGRVMPGDQVCLFDGAPIYYLLRRCETETRKGTYRLTSKAYLHNAMDGEVDALGLESREKVLVQILNAFPTLVI